jgi:hypothetical protein
VPWAGKCGQVHCDARSLIVARSSPLTTARGVSVSRGFRLRSLRPVTSSQFALHAYYRHDTQPALLALLAPLTSQTHPPRLSSSRPSVSPPT